MKYNQRFYFIVAILILLIGIILFEFSENLFPLLTIKYHPSLSAVVSTVSRHDEYREVYLNRIRKIGVGAINGLATVAESSDIRKLKYAIWGLSEVNDWNSREIILKHIRDIDPVIRELSTSALIKLNGAIDGELLDVCLNDLDPEVRKNAIWLGQRDLVENKMNKLRSMAGDESPVVRMEIIAVLRRNNIFDRVIIDDLCKDSNDNVRRSASLLSN